MDNRKDKRFVERNTVFIKSTSEAQEALYGTGSTPTPMTSPCPERGSAPPNISPSAASSASSSTSRRTHQSIKVDGEIKWTKKSEEDDDPLRERRRVPAQHLADAALADQAPLRGEERRRHPHGRLPLIRPRPRQGFPVLEQQADEDRLEVDHLPVVPPQPVG